MLVLHQGVQLSMLVLHEVVQDTSSGDIVVYVDHTHSGSSSSGGSSLPGRVLPCDDCPSRGDPYRSRLVRRGSARGNYLLSLSIS